MRYNRLLSVSADVRSAGDVIASEDTWVIGDFVWTAFDYIGESSIGFETETELIDECAALEPFPFHLSYCGDLDLVGDPKPQAAYRSVLWGVSAIEVAVHVPIAPGCGERVGPWGWVEERPSWSWGGHEGPGSTGMHINVYAKDCCDSVRLYVNGEAVGGDAPVSFATQYTATFDPVQYKPGNLTAAGFKNGSVVPGAVKTLMTAGAVAKLVLTVDQSTIRHSRNDLAYVSVAAHDAAGTLVPDSDLNVTFKLTAHSAASTDGDRVGAGTFDTGGDASTGASSGALLSGAPPLVLEIAAVGSGDPKDLTTMAYGSSKKLWRGRALAILRPAVNAAGPGTATLTATAGDLTASVSISTTAW